MPLQYGTKKLVLVGDPCQLPATVTSRQAQARGYDRPLLTRIFPTLKAWDSVTLLDTQYRMHPEILVFPNARFYQGLLKTGRSVLERKSPASGPFPPFVVFHVEGYESKVQDSYANHDEAKLAVKIIKIFRETPGLADKSIAVISPYRGQVKVRPVGLPRGAIGAKHCGDTDVRRGLCEHLLGL